MLIPNISSVDAIYEGEGGFNYSLPRSVLETQLDGTAFGRNIKYTPDEQAAILLDMQELAQSVFGSLQNTDEKRAVVSCGSPGSGKTTVMRQLLKGEASPMGYTDPDDVCLLGMKATFLTDIQNGMDEIAVKSLSTDERAQAIAQMRLAAYTKWRPASNAINNLLLAHLIKSGASFYFGTTSSAVQTGIFYKFLIGQGYKVELVHVSAPDEVRWKSVQQRDDTFVQTTEQDTREKGEMVPQRLRDTYIAYGDTIRFYYRTDSKADAVLAAIWTRTSGHNPAVEPTGEIEVINQEAFEALKANHDSICDRIGKPDVLWEKCMNTTTVKS